MTEENSPLAFQPAHDVVELIEAAVADGERAAAVGVLDGDAEAERVGEALLQRQRVGVLRRLRYALNANTPSILSLSEDNLLRLHS